VRKRPYYWWPCALKQNNVKRVLHVLGTIDDNAEGIEKSHDANDFVMEPSTSNAAQELHDSENSSNTNKNTTTVVNLGKFQKNG